MKHFALIAGIAAVVLLGFNTTSTALSPQSLMARPSAQAVNFGTTEVVNITLHDSQLSYVVPDGKVLHVEHLIWALESGHTHQTVSIVPGGDVPGVGDLLLKFSVTAEDSWTAPRPIRIVGDGNAGLRILDNGAVDWRDVTVFGFLTDA